MGVRASFVLYRSGGDVNMSARSLGDVNVQVILEEFGGGGHFTMAGAQIKNATVADVRRSLIRELDDKLGKRLCAEFEKYWRREASAALRKEGLP